MDPTAAPRLWYRCAARILRLRIHTFGRVEEGRPLLIAANHSSWTDVIVLGSIFKGSFIAKGEVGRWPVVGFLAQLQGTVLVDRQNKRSSGSQVSELAGKLAGGRAMLLFAEGTTSDGTNILPFKTTLFGAAKTAVTEAGAPEVLIQPVAIAYTRTGGLPMGRRLRGLCAWTGDEELLPHLTTLLRLPPIDVEVHWGEPVAFTATTDRKTASREVEQRVRAMFAAALATPVPSSRG
ncbi:1-acyl-sn-glycerol-3-phosphate acyltransferase [Tianweitania sediminis]|uniref:1-acyl-sn-glycerol-3-phosphate acyltransferase n=2 Tax=Tianweitania sediminis TaxID=1502156 RepID=A0A8J7R3V2_9HYPH|nr:1-acyl-sn-glycerol-3-phosphate acyltransferase [Tianweitania sediminis]